MQEKEEREEKVEIQNCVLIYNSSFNTNLGKYLFFFHLKQCPFKLMNMEISTKKPNMSM